MVAAANIVTDMYATGDLLCSVSGQYPKVNETRAEYRAAAAARGTGWHQFGAAEQAVLSILYLTEYGDLNSQSEIGNGRVSLSNGDWVASEIHDGTNYGYIGKCGLSNSDGNATNANNDATDLEVGESPAYMTYRGVENWWGNVWAFVDGVNIHNSTANGSQLYLCSDPTVFADDTSTGYTLVGNLAEDDGYSTDIIDAIGIWPSAVGGSSSTRLADYYYTYFDNDNDSGWRSAIVVGRADTGSAAGVSCVNSTNGSSIVSVGIGGRLCYREVQ
jgi:hypothetical protein